jgi:hypothetical protein
MIPVLAPPPIMTQKGSSRDAFDSELLWVGVRLFLSIKLGEWTEVRIRLRYSKRGLQSLERRCHLHLVGGWGTEL